MTDAVSRDLNSRARLQLGGAAATLPIFAATIFLGAVLVFGVQPIAARMILPYFGGSPAVWSAASLFFQLALLAGYAYSFALTRYVAPRFQPLVHLPVIAIPLLLLPLILPLSNDSLRALPPAVAVMSVLAIGVGLPFVVASTTGPLLQRWFSFIGHRWSEDPYFLYAASNTGSLLVLLAYPFVIEPRLDLADQSTAWSFGYLLFAVLAAGCAALVMRSAPREQLADASHDRGARLTWTARARWLLLAAVPAALSLGVTQHISTDVAAIPLLWIAPLALYLLSFVLAFSRSNPLTAPLAGRLLPLALGAVITAPFLSPPIWAMLCVHLTFLFLAATMCHARLASERPEPARLTEFYLLLSIGGALGGAFVSLVAPIVFERVWEYPIAVVAALLLRPRVEGRPSRRSLAVLAAVVLGAAAVVVVSTSAPTMLPTMAPVLALGICLLAIARWRPILAGATAIILAYMTVGDTNAIYTDRTFFGVYQVTENQDGHSLVHGTTVHGMQFSDSARRSIPTAYFHSSGPIGQIFDMTKGEPRDIGVIGLGVGTLAAYGQPGDRMTFYEIDPAVVSLARNPALFTFIADSPATVKTVVADGRLGLAEDETQYDLIVLDAFSSDAIPVHLLTKEAFSLYADRITDSGLIAVNITNRFVDLAPVLGGVAQSLGLRALVQDDHNVSQSQEAEGKRPSTWVLIAPRTENLRPFMDDDLWRPASVERGARVWTDGYADLIGALR